MKFSVGDQVLLLHSGEIGEVLELLNDEMVLVRVGTVEFPVFADQIDFPYFRGFSEKPRVGKAVLIPGEQIPRETGPVLGVGDHGIWLSMLPVYQNREGEELVHLLKLHLTNEGPIDLGFRYQLWLKQNLFLELESQVRAYSHLYLHDLLFEQLNDNPRFELVLRPLVPQPELAPSVRRTLRPRAAQIFAKLNQAVRRSDATFRFEILDRYPMPSPETDQVFTPPPAPALAETFHGPLSALDLPRYEVDLHIENLLEDWKGLSNFEILTIQLREFEKWLQIAIAHRQYAAVFIHGVGKGRLRDEIHLILKNTPEVRSFVNQYDVRYGFGATEVFFQYDG
ncbi:MAG TPA: Smr/MutS family protein [Chitinophagaceae bacterium]|nr:Smr/MutS family protein [Chitinophagaceae bacterium]